MFLGHLPTLLVVPVSIGLHAIFAFFPLYIFRPLKYLLFPIKTKLAIILIRLSVKEQKEMIICLFSRDF